MLVCVLCLLNVQIFINAQGECLDIVADGNHYPCIKEVMIDTGCYDGEGNTELCNAQWIQI